MKFKVNFFCICFLLHTVMYLYGQTFSKSYPNAVLDGNSFLHSNGKEIAILNIKGSTSTQKGAVITKVNNEGDILWIRDIPELDYRNSNTTSISNPVLLLESGEIVFTTNYQVLTERKYIIGMLSASGDLLWSKIVSHDTNTLEQPRLLQLTDNSFLTINCIRTSVEKNIISIQKFDLSGNIVFEKQIIDNNESDADEYLFSSLTRNKIAIIKNSEQNCSISIVDENFTFIERFDIDMNVKQIIESDGAFYLCGAKFPFSLFSNRSIVTKLDFNKQVEWSKEVDLVSGFRYYTMMIDKNNIFYKTIDQSKSVGVLISISQEGDFVDGKLYHLGVLGLRPAFSKFGENLLLDVNQQNGENLIYVDSVNFESDCYRPRACVDLLENTVNVKNNLDSIYISYDLFVFVDSINLFSSSVIEEGRDFCIEADFTFPVPSFKLEDTICINETVQFYNLNNSNADSVRWLVADNEIASSSENYPLPFSFSEPGVYSVAQEIFHDGCFDVYKKDVVVRSPISIENLPTSILSCENESVSLNASSHGIKKYNWFDGSTDSLFVAKEPGMYTVEIGDDYCVQSHTFELSFFDYSLIDVEIPSDTTVCKQIGLDVRPRIDISVNFQWSDNHNSLNRIITESGEYWLKTSIGECNTKVYTQVWTEDCSTQLYMANIFSPNFDGINDTYYPQGDFFDVLDFRIYDRWGNLLHCDSLEAWDGNFNGIKTPTGVYIYVLQIRNTLLDEIETLKGNVTLMR